MEIQTMAIISSLLTRAAIVVLAAVPLSALAGETQCPKRHAGSQLTTVTLFDGPPSEHADLEPDTFHQGKNGSRSEWDVAYVYKLGRHLFVQCQYGPKTPAVLLEPVPSTYKCEFISQGAENVSLVCKSH
jgi:hypothetical protein